MNSWFPRVVMVVIAGVLVLAPQGLLVTDEGLGQLTSAVSSEPVSAQDAPNGACSPPPQCLRDRDCDPNCGKGNGVCIRVNSCYRQCACSS